MSIRSFWAILLKLLGVYIILQSLTAIPSFVLSIFSIISIEANEGRGMYDGMFTLIAYFILIIGIFALILWCCLVKTDWIIDKLKLDEGFIEERFEISMHRTSILKIAVILIGGLTLVDSLPVLCKDLFNSLQQSSMYGNFGKNPNSGYILLNLVRTIFGIFMLTSSRLIVNFIERKRKQPVTETIA